VSFDPDYMSSEFAIACQGYLSIDPCRLPDMLCALPDPVSARERAVVAAIRWRMLAQEAVAAEEQSARLFYARM